MGGGGKGNKTSLLNMTGKDKTWLRVTSRFYFPKIKHKLIRYLFLLTIVRFVLLRKLRITKLL